MKIKEQWLVMIEGYYRLLVLTENQGYFIEKGNKFIGISSSEANKKLTEISYPY